MKTFILSIIATSAIAFSQEMHTVYAGNMYFQPSELNINQGDSVEFINEGGYHDVVVTSGPEIMSLEPCSGPCDIGVLVFDVVGDYDYECSIGSHASQGMVGTIIVAAVQQLSQVQIIHNSPYPVVDVYVDGEVALNSVPYRAVTGMIDLPASTTVGIAPAGGSVIAEFPFELEQNGTYVVTASGIVGDESTPFDLVPSSLELTAVDDQSFALKVYHGATDAPPVDIYANGSLLVENIAYGNYAGYLQVPEGDYTIDVTAHGSLASVASFYAPLTGQGGGSGIVYASGFLSPTEQDSAFTLILATPSGYSVELPNTESALQITNERNIVLEGFTLQQNYPNPFNPNTSITFNLTKNQLVNLTIYDLRGNEIKSLYNNTAEAGTHKINWNGLDNLGKKVSSGVLIYTLKTNYGVDTKKMVLMK